MHGIELIGAPQSVYVRTARMAFEEKGVSYTLRPAAPHSPEVLAIHPFGKIPAMRDGDFQLFECKAIATYVDRAFPAPSLIPEDARLAAITEQWISAINTSVFPGVIGYMQANAFPNGANGKPDAAVVEASLPAIRRNIAILDGAVRRGGHLAGETFTLADMFLMPILAYLRMFPESAALVATSPSLNRYFLTHAERASFRATQPPPLSELRRP